MITALIVDDSASARQNLKADLAKHCPQIKVVGEADAVLSGLKALQQLQPDLLLLDIHLPDGTGFDLLELSGKQSFKLIFTTASDAHAIKAFKFSAIDYLLKPIDPEELKAAIEKAGNTSPSAEQLDLLKEKLHPAKAETFEKIALHTAEKIHLVPLSEIVRCEADVNYTGFTLKNGQRILVTKTLKHFDQLLSPMGFSRVHQSHLINLSTVKEFVKGDGGYLVLHNGENVPVSTRKKTEVLEQLARHHA